MGACAGVGWVEGKAEGEVIASGSGRALGCVGGCGSKLTMCGVAARGLFMPAG